MPATSTATTSPCCCRRSAGGRRLGCRPSAGPSGPMSDSDSGLKSDTGLDMGFFIFLILFFGFGEENGVGRGGDF